jgi:FixJ family two-component response regulator
MCAEHFVSAEALLEAKGVSPRCYVIDVDLPGMSGFDLQSRLRACVSGIPVVLITADDDPELSADAVERGAAAVLVKPFAGRALGNAVRDVTARRGSAAPQ